MMSWPASGLLLARAREISIKGLTLRVPAALLATRLKSYPRFVVLESLKKEAKNLTRILLWKQMKFKLLKESK